MKRRDLLVTISSLIAVFVIVVGIANASNINQQMHDWKLLPEPERLTELYFTDHTSLPTTYAPGDAQTVSFTIHNLEYRDMTYTYTLYQTSENDNHKLPLASGSITLKQNQYGNQKALVTLGDLGRSQVSIQLSPVNESIHYWINRG